jgi:SAP domain
MTTPTPPLSQQSIPRLPQRRLDQRPRWIAKFSTSTRLNGPETAPDQDAPSRTSDRENLPDDLNQLTVKELKDLLAQRSLKVSGLKSELIERLQTSAEASAPDSDFQTVVDESARSLDTTLSPSEAPSIQDIVEHPEAFPESTVTSIFDSTPIADVETSTPSQSPVEPSVPDIDSVETPSIIPSSLFSDFSTPETFAQTSTPQTTLEKVTEESTLSVERIESTSEPSPTTSRPLRKGKQPKQLKSAKTKVESTDKTAGGRDEPKLDGKTLTLEELSKWQPGAVFDPERTLQNDSKLEWHQLRLDNLLDLRCRMFAARGFEAEMRKGPQRSNFLLNFRLFPHYMLDGFQKRFTEIMKQWAGEKSAQELSFDDFQTGWYDTIREFQHTSAYRFKRQVDKRVKEVEGSPERIIDDVKLEAYELRERYKPIDALARFLPPEVIPTRRGNKSTWVRQGEKIAKRRDAVAERNIRDEISSNQIVNAHDATPVATTSRVKSPEAEASPKMFPDEDKSQRPRREIPSLFAELTTNKEMQFAAKAMSNSVTGSVHPRQPEPSELQSGADTNFIHGPSVSRVAPRELASTSSQTSRPSFPQVSLPGSSSPTPVPAIHSWDKPLFPTKSPPPIPAQKTPIEYNYQQAVKELLSVINGKRDHEKPADMQQNDWKLYAYKIFTLKNMGKTIRLAITNRTRREFLRRAESEHDVGPFHTDDNPLCQIFNPMWKRLGLMNYISGIESTREENEFEVTFKNIDGASAFVNRVDEHWLDDRTIGQVYATWKEGRHEDNHWASLIFPRRTLDIWRRQAVKRGAPVGPQGYPNVQWTRAIWAVFTRMRYSIGSYGDVRGFNITDETPYRAVAEVRFKDNAMLEHFLKRNKEHYISNDWKDRFFARERYRYGY